MKILIRKQKNQERMKKNKENMKTLIKKSRKYENFDKKGN